MKQYFYIALTLFICLQGTLTTCPTNKDLRFQQFGSRCYSFVPTPMKWLEAKNYCKNRGTRLVTIRNPSENHHVLSIITQRSWTGFNDLASENKFQWLANIIKVNYTNWHQGEPNDDKGNEDCVEIFSQQEIAPGMWNDRSCDEKLTSVCMTEADDPVCQTTRNFSSFTKFGTRCYLLYSTPETWMVAMDLCKRLGSELVAINNKFDNQNVLNIISERSWIGLHVSNKQASLRWTDNSEPTYSNWPPDDQDDFCREPSHKGEPDDCQGDCVEIVPETDHGAGEWNTRSCDASLPFVCTTDAGTQTGRLTTTSLPKETNESCEAGKWRDRFLSFMNRHVEKPFPINPTDERFWRDRMKHLPRHHQAFSSFIEADEKEIKEAFQYYNSDPKNYGKNLRISKRKFRIVNVKCPKNHLHCICTVEDLGLKKVIAAVPISGCPVHFDGSANRRRRL